MQHNCEGTCNHSTPPSPHHHATTRQPHHHHTTDKSRAVNIDDYHILSYIYIFFMYGDLFIVISICTHTYTIIYSHTINIEIYCEAGVRPLYPSATASRQHQILIGHMENILHKRMFLIYIYIYINL